MRTVTYHGPARNLRLASGRLVPRDIPTEVTNAEAEQAEASGHDVTVED